MNLKKIHFTSIDSTNSFGMRMNFDSNYIYLITSDHQTQGRGRYHRPFVSQDKKGIYLSIVYKPAIEQLNYLIFKSANAIVYALKRQGFETQIKWTNDIYYQHKKIAGILCEGKFIGHTLERYIIGIGINFKQQNVSKELHQKIGYVPIKEIELFKNDLLDYLFNDISPKEIIAEYKKHCLTLHQWITINNLYGKAIDINTEGELVLETPEGVIQTLSTGETQ